jgi:hypothetical protein
MKLDLSRYIDFQAYYLKHVAKAKRSGDELTGLCPFHEDREQSFSVNIRTGLWKCYAGCGGGNVVTFHARMQNIGTKEAFKDLCSTYNVPLREKPASNESQPEKSKKPSSVQNTDDLAQTLSTLPPPPEKVMDYLEGKRGWSREIIERFEIRYNPKDQRILIPVEDESGAIVNIRRYKPKASSAKMLSWKRGRGQSRLFPLSSLEEARKSDGMILLCEGEPDVLCGLSNGLPCITQTAGAGTWKDEFNTAFKGLDVVIVYDNDEPGRKGAQRAAKFLPDFARSVSILQWPEWMEDGEDLTDWFVKYDKSKEELLKLSRIECAPTGKDVGGTNDARRIVEKGGAYWRIEFDKKGPSETKISNFTLQVLKNFYMPDGVIRNVRLTHENGTFSIDADLHPHCMASKQAFSAWCFSQGNFVWKGSLADLEKVWEVVLEQNDGKMIHRPDHIGWIPHHKIWLFADCAVKDGRVHTPDDEGIIWVDDVGYQPLGIDAGSQDSDPVVSPLLPIPRWDLSKEAANSVRLKIIEKLKENLGGHQAYMALGFVAYTAYYQEIFREYKAPILYVYGRRQCGKNTFAKIIMAHYGLGEECTDNISKITPVALSRKLAYYSAVPVWVDEYRNDQQCQRHDSTLRSAYDGIGGSKGRLGHGLVVPRVRAPLIITGEAFPEDSALGSRCAMVYLSAGRRRDEIFKDVKALMPQLSAVYLHLILGKTEEWVRELLRNIEETKNALERADRLDPRLAAIYAVISESFCTIYAPELPKDERRAFVAWLRKEAHAMKEETTENMALNEFFNDLEWMHAKGALNGHHVEIKGKYVDGNFRLDTVSIWLHAVYGAWIEEKRKQGKQVWGKRDIKRYLEEEPYFVKEATQRIDGAARKCVVLKWDRMPEALQNIFWNGWGQKM